MNESLTAFYLSSIIHVLAGEQAHASEPYLYDLFLKERVTNNPSHTFSVLQPKLQNKNKSWNNICIKCKSKECNLKLSHCEHLKEANTPQNSLSCPIDSYSKNKKQSLTLFYYFIHIYIHIHIYEQCRWSAENNIAVWLTGHRLPSSSENLHILSI